MAIQSQDGPILRLTKTKKQMIKARIVILIIVALLGSLGCWQLVDKLIVHVTLIQYIFIEILLVSAHLFYKFVAKNF